MAETPREELAELVRLFSTHVAWQRELGAAELPHKGALPAVPVTLAGDGVAATPAPPPSVPTPAVVPVAAVAPVVAPVPVPLPAPEDAGRVAALRVIQGEVQACTRCGLAATRRNTVFARGDAFARLCFIGEGPGEQEDLQALPFVGPAGQLLDRIIVGMGLRPDDVYVCNVVKCRPPHNRVPAADEMAACTPFLARQIDLVAPAVIVALGRTAASYLLESKVPMGKLRGKWHEYRSIPVMPTWHPSYVLRENDRPGSTARREVWEDMKLVLERLALPVPRRG